MKTIKLELPGQKTGTSYNILIGAGIIDSLGERILEACKGEKPVKAGIITDSNVAAIYLEKTKDALQKQGFEVWSYIFQSGDTSKNMETLNDILCGLAEEGFNRGDVLVALGGGVTGDITGFAAAVYMRGMDYVQVPTTLLAAIDSSVGGKTAVNLKAGKNMAGAFWQPSMVLCDVETLKTLPAGVFREGLAEAVKYGFIKDRSILDTIGGLNSSNIPLLEEIAAKCIGIKCAIVQADERDLGERMLLNFGHTIGHAIEKLSNYRITHGEAVAMGMVAEARGAYKMGYSPWDFSIELDGLLGQLGFDTDLKAFDKSQLREAVLKDKKWMSKEITMIIPEEIGTCRLQKIDTDELTKYIDSIFN